MRRDESLPRKTSNLNSRPLHYSPDFSSDYSILSRISTEKQKDVPNTLTNSLSDSALQDKAQMKAFMKKELERLKEFPEKEYKAGINKLLQMSRPLAGPSILTVESSKVGTRSGSLRSLECPSPSNHYKTIRSPSNLILQPLFTVSNCIARAGFKSRTGTINGKSKYQNQSAAIIKPNLQNVRGQYLFAVCSGHGPIGHKITDAIKEKYHSILELALPREFKSDYLIKTLNTVSEKVDLMLNDSSLDINFSGCTMVTIIISGNICTCGNIGDCRAIIGRNTTTWEAIPLSNDHNLNKKKERERILQCNARIDEEIDQNGKPTGIEKIYIGNERHSALESTRSFGNKIGKHIGVINDPEVSTTVLSTNDKFIIIASPAVWKIITNIEAVCIVRNGWENNRTDLSCQELTDEVERRYNEKNTDKDDINIIVAYINVND